MKGVLEEGAEVIQEIEKGSDSGCRFNCRSAAGRTLRNRGIWVGACLRAICWSKTDIVELLEETLEEEKAADEKLTKISETVESRGRKLRPSFDGSLSMMRTKGPNVCGVRAFLISLRMIVVDSVYA